MAKYDRNSNLWSNDDGPYFHDFTIKPIRQQGPHCVSTVLAMLTQQQPKDFQGKMNTQDPSSWSDSLRAYGMKLAYCPTDVRKMKHYIEELIAFDDLFTISFYTSDDPRTILGDPDKTGWICGSHIIILHRDKIIDPVSGRAVNAREYDGLNFHTKRIFRVVPATHNRGL